VGLLAWQEPEGVERPASVARPVSLLTAAPAVVDMLKVVGLAAK
jgi:hypothetical protein